MLDAFLEIGGIAAWQGWKSNKGRQTLCLKADGALELVAGTSVIPLAELIGYQDGAYSLAGVL